MYVLCYPFDPKMKLVVGNMLLLPLLSEKIKILFRKSAEFMSWVFLGWVFFGIVISMLYYASLFGNLWGKWFYYSLEV